MDEGPNAEGRSIGDVEPKSANAADPGDPRGRVPVNGTSRPGEEDSQHSIYEDAQSQTRAPLEPHKDGNNQHRQDEGVRPGPGLAPPLHNDGLGSSSPTITGQAGDHGAQDDPAESTQQLPPEGGESRPAGDAGGTASLQVHWAIRHRNLAVLGELLAQRVGLETADEHGGKPLYLAAELGFQEAVEWLLEAGADVESLNAESSTHSTALHRAVDGNHLQIAETLLEKGADVNAANPKGRTSLFAAIRNRNIAMIELLLNFGADKDIQDVTGSTAFNLADGDEEILSLLRANRLLQGPSTAGLKPSQQPKHPVFELHAPEHDENKIIACNGFRATVVDFFIGDQHEYRMEKSLSVFELLYGSSSIFEPPANGRKRDFRWYHLPANNMEWVEDLLRRRLCEGGTVPDTLSDHFKSLAGLAGSSDRQYTATNPLSFMRPTCRSFKIHPDGEQSAHDNVVAFTPYLHFEVQSQWERIAAAVRDILSSTSKRSSRLGQKPQGRRRRKTREAFDDPETLHRHLLRGYLVSNNPSRAPPLQPRRTLDQYFYTHLDTIDRDKDQVVYRYTRSTKEPKMFMVDQLWLWIINEDTVISCAPVSLERLEDHIAATKSAVNETNEGAAPELHAAESRPRAWIRSKNKRRTHQWIASLGFQIPQPMQDRLLDQEMGEDAGIESNQYTIEVAYRPLNVHHNILQHLHQSSRAPIGSPYELASVIVNHCANVFDHHAIPADFQFFDFFEQSIGEVSNHAARLLKQFRHAATFLRGEELHEQLDIQSEAQLLVEIEDIYDELIILRMVLRDQRDIMKNLAKILDPLAYDKHADIHSEILTVKENQLLESHLQRIDTMEKMTRKTRKTLLSLLDLKQRQASIAEALSSVSYAKQGSEQAEETARQGRTLMLFTVVTILFLPLSFMAAFFAIQIDVFPVNESGKLDLGYVLKYMLSISAGLSIPFIVIAFNQERFVAWLRTIRPRITTGLMILSAVILFVAVIMVVVWTSPLDYGLKLGVTIGTVLFGFLCIVALGIRRLFTAAQKASSFVESDSGLIDD